MKRLFAVFFLLLPLCISAQEGIEEIFPKISELPGSNNHWIANILPPEKSNDCEVHSATYAYFTDKAEPLFDIPRKNIYSVNIRFHLCENVLSANKLYSKFAEVGEKDKKRLIGIGDKGILYVEPLKENPIMGNYYLSSLYKNIVMQIHADDGFVLMDIASMMSNRLGTYLMAGSDISNGLTLTISKDGYETYKTVVPVTKQKAKKIEFSGILFDQYSKRVPKADIKVLETGAAFQTDENGEFRANIGADNGTTAKIFRPLNITKMGNKILSSGYYAVDITYKNSEKIGQDHWKLHISPEGKITGISKNISSGGTLSLSGTLEKDNIKIIRNCSGGGMHSCRQTFNATLKDDIFQGNWSGSGGGGSWRLYKNSFEEKIIQVSMKEAGFTLKGAQKDGGWLLENGSAIQINKTSDYKHDFYLNNATLRCAIKTSDMGRAEISLSSGLKNSNELARSALLQLPFQSEALINITDIYKFFTGKNLYMHISSDKKISAVIKPTVELSYAKALSKANAKGALKISDINYKAKDIAGDAKRIKSNGKPDISFKVDISAYGNTLKGAQITTAGREKRQWHTGQSSISPGIAFISDNGTILNNEDGSVYYPFTKTNESLQINIDKGSISQKNIDSFEIILFIDDDKVHYSYPTGG